MTPDELRRATSEHEAAHAAAAILLGLDVHSVAVGSRDVHADPGARLVGLTAVPVDVRDADELHRRAIATLVPLVDEPGGAPDWPLPDDAPDGGDVAQVAAIVKALDLDADGYRRLTTDALALSLRDDYRQLRDGIAHLVEQRGHLDAPTVRAAVETLTKRDPPMQHAVKAATVEATTDRGEFAAIAATWTVDRVKDQIVRGAFADTIARWRASGKRLPLHWNHSGEAKDIIGSIDPATMRETADGLHVEGRLDLDGSDVAREAWRAMRSGAMSLSFGYSTTRSRKRGDGVTELHELDLFEVSIVPIPANPATRVVEMKAYDDERDDRNGDDDPDRIRQEGADLIRRAFAHVDATADDRDAELRAKSAEYIVEHAPVRVRMFDA